MKNTLLSLLLILSAMADSQAQYYTNRNKVWAFGHKAGLNFTSGSPVPIGTSLDHATYSEGSASVCDTDGHLLFYTNGKSVYNRNHLLMPSGASIVPFQTSSTSQGAVIVPVIGSASLYYLFSLQEFVGSSADGQLAYGIINMSLDGGNGDVVTSSASHLLEDSLSEKMIAVRGTNNNIWLVTHRRDTAIFLAYEITSTGIDTVPVTSAVGTFSRTWGYAFGVMKSSHNSRKIILQSSLSSTAAPVGTELYDFDPATGIVSNCIVLNTTDLQYGAEFSPDNKKVYTCNVIGSLTFDTMSIYQYDISLASSAAIVSSKTLISRVVTRGNGDLRLAPDNKIYFSGQDDSAMGAGLNYSRYLDCISTPNLAGASCGYISHVVKLPDTTGIFGCLPNVVITEKDTTAISVNIDWTISNSGITLFPNPAATELTITATTPVNSLTITDAQGRQVYSSSYNSEMVKVNIATLPPNIYFIKVNGTSVRQFVKQ